MNADKLRELNDRLLICGNDCSDVLLDGAAEIERLRAERDKLRADLQFMVENAAVKHRPAYDEQQLIIMALRDRVAELTSLLMEAVNEMEPDIEAKYANAHGYPSMNRKYEQDMDLPRRIRAALAGKEGE